MLASTISLIYAAIPVVLRQNGAPLELIGLLGIVFFALYQGAVIMTHLTGFACPPAALRFAQRCDVP